MQGAGTAVLLFLVLNSVDCQLIGFRGVIQLPDGELYRDKETRDASEAVAQFAARYQPRLKVVALENKLVEQQRNHNKKRSDVAFFSKVGRDPTPIYLHPNEIVDFTFSRNMNPIEELRLNKKFDEIEVQKATPPSRLLPEDYYVTTPSTRLIEEFKNNFGPATASPPPPPKPHQTPTCSGSSCSENHIDTDSLQEPRRSRFGGSRPNPSPLNSAFLLQSSSLPTSRPSFSPSLSSSYSLFPSASYNPDNRYVDARSLPVDSNQYSSDMYSYTNRF